MNLALNYRRILALALLVLPLAIRPAGAAVRLGPPFGDHMVLQQGVPLAIWGTGCPGGDSVKVYIQGQNVTARSDWEGRWFVQLAPLKAGGPFQMLIQIGGSGPLVPNPAANDRGGAELNDILVGEVVQASAAPNLPASAANNRLPATASEPVNPYAFVRVFTGQAGGDGQWTFISQQTGSSENAALFNTARDLYDKLHVPIGIVDASNGPVCSQPSGCLPHQENSPAPAH